MLNCQTVSTNLCTAKVPGPPWYISQHCLFRAGEKFQFWQQDSVTPSKTKLMTVNHIQKQLGTQADIFVFGYKAADFNIACFSLDFNIFNIGESCQLPQMELLQLLRQNNLFYWKFILLIKKFKGISYHQLKLKLSLISLIINITS